MPRSHRAPSGQRLYLADVKPPAPKGNGVRIRLRAARRILDTGQSERPPQVSQAQENELDPGLSTRSWWNGGVPWKVLEVERLHDGDILRLERAVVELNDGTTVDSHYILRVPLRVVSLVLRNDRQQYLLLRRHRFIVDRWCWDIPAGKVGDGEDFSAAARRAAIEETGWRPTSVREIGFYHPNPGLSDQVFTVYLGEGAERVGQPNPNETEDLEWASRDAVLARIRDREIDGLSLTSLLLALVER